MCADALGNGIGDVGAVALVVALKEMQNLKELDLRGKCSIYGIAWSLVMMGWIKGNVGLLREVWVDAWEDTSICIQEHDQSHPLSEM